ncbi:MAG: hypothetical protein B7Y43_12755 [Sphingomonas sp. 28-62-20]|uniref:patatin-like phospholipase family protein n=1 Tax=Sphingomonas sp. 28-62-20 TaxID=1970433 RepID=UPI000BCDA3DD|nr:MAG: hypothetical protein B7Y43_12755 [Sphingomonas sp. 28-62-20]
MIINTDITLTGWPAIVIQHWLPKDAPFEFWLYPLGALFLFISTVIFASLIKISLEELRSMRVMSADPLRTTLAEFLSTRPIVLPTYVTMAASKYIFNPDTEGNSPIPTTKDWTGKLVVDQDLVLARSELNWIPRYVRIDSSEPIRTVECLLASSALPFGIVSSVFVDTDYFVDGGVVDNEPILPLLTHHLDKIIVLHLSPKKKEETAADVDHFDRCAKLLRLTQLADGLGPHKLYALKELPDSLDAMSFPSVRPFYPARKLGGIFDGLLNFSPEYAQRMIALGRKETLANLDGKAQISAARLES